MRAQLQHLIDLTTKPNTSDVERYTLRFNHLVSRALGPDESRTMIAALAERMA